MKKKYNLHQTSNDNKLQQLNDMNFLTQNTDVWRSLINTATPHTQTLQRLLYNTIFSNKDQQIKY